MNEHFVTFIQLQHFLIIVKFMENTQIIFSHLFYYIRWHQTWLNRKDMD